MKRAILMCAGEYEPVQIPRKAGDLVVAVDAGLERLLAQQVDPDLILGDFDSLDGKYLSYLEKTDGTKSAEIHRLPCEKDDTDTMYALRVCLERGYREILLYGALGGRLDHTIANVQALAWLKRRGADGYLLGKRTLVTVVEKEKVLLPEGFEGTFSLFALDSRVTGVTLEGMKYPLTEAVMENALPIGVSNEVSSEIRASAAVREGLVLMILEIPADAEAENGVSADSVPEEGGHRILKGGGEIPDPALLTRLPL